MTIICLITTKETSDKGYLNGSAMYHSNKKNINILILNYLTI